jgi:RNA polymerase sigma-70 factor (ECF subfamily)
MHRFEEKKYHEIAEELGISVKTVDNQISKALKILREKLSSHL